MIVRRLLVVTGLGACVYAVRWVVAGHSASPAMVNNANLIGGLFGVLSAAITIAAFWPRRRTSPPPAASVPAGVDTRVAVQGGIHGGPNVVAGSIGTLYLHGPVQEMAGASSEPLTVSQLQRGPAVTDRWRHTTSGVSSCLSRLDHTSMPRPAYGSGFSPSRPTVKIGILVACDPPGPELSASQRRACFLGLLNSDAVMTLVRAVTSVHPELKWVSCGGHGPRMLGAALAVATDQAEIPIASARLQFPEPGAVQPLTDPDRAEFILEVRCVSDAGLPCLPADLLTWRDRMLLALALPAVIVSFLQDQLRVATYATPSTEFGTWWATDNDITRLVDITGLRVEPGTYRSAHFTGWAVADVEGEPVNQVVRAILAQLADYTLHLEDYEDLLDPQPSPPGRS